jgi:hypothetical protein
MRNVIKWTSMLALVVVAIVSLEAIGTIDEIRLEDGRDDNNRIAAAVVDGAASQPLIVAPLTAAFNKKAKIVRRGATGFFTKGPEYNLDPKVDLALLLTDALRTEAAAMGFKVASSGDGWKVGGTIKDIYLESKQIPYGATLFYGYMDVEWSVARGSAAPEVRRMRFHSYTGGYNAGIGRKDEAAVGLAHLLIEGAQEAVARLNQELFKAPPQALIAAKAKGVQSSVTVNELHHIALSGETAAAPSLLALLTKELDENRRSALIETLGRLGATEAVAPLASRYGTEDEDCRWYTLKTLDYIGGDAALALVRDQGLKDKDGGPRRLAERIVGKTN